MRLGLISAILIFAGNAHAAPVTYTFLGKGDFTVENTSFTNASFSIVGQGDSTGIVDASGGNFSNNVTAMFETGGVVVGLQPLTRVGSFAGLISFFSPGG